MLTRLDKALFLAIGVLAIAFFTCAIIGMSQ
jgi:hypothetical protein